MSCYHLLPSAILIPGGDIMAHPKKAEKDKYKKMSISFEPEQLNKLISYCEKEERTASWVIRKALAEWFENHNI